MIDDDPPDDTAPITGTRSGYVPCFDLASSDDPADDDASPISGRRVSYVPVGQSAASDDPADDDASPISGQSVGFVPGPCGAWQIIDTFDVRTECDPNDWNVADNDRSETRPWESAGGG